MAATVNRHVASQTAFDQANTWIEDCLHQHEQQICPSNDEVDLPTRLIDVTSAIPRLVRTKGQKGRYVALSYCWGGPQHLMLTQERMEDYERRLPENLPQTIQDAVRVARSLNIRFLWIDAFCIIQNNDDDREKELASMGNIYKCAFVTIMAASAWDAQEGFLATRKEQANSVTVPLLIEGGYEGTVTLTPRHPDPAMVYFRENPIESRAWTFQEKMLSPRQLIYSRTNLRWICGTKSAYNGGSSSMLGEQMHFPLTWRAKKGFISDLWHQNVAEFTRRSISQPKDKLPAIAALAEEHASRSDDFYVAGLWQSNLFRDLMWVVVSDSLVARRPLSPRAPSWSWAAVEEPVQWVPKRSPEGHSLVPDAEYEFLTWNPVYRNQSLQYGELLVGSELVVRGRLVSLGTQRAVIRKARVPDHLPQIKEQFAGSMAQYRSKGLPIPPYLKMQEELNHHDSIRFDDSDGDESCQPDDRDVFFLLLGQSKWTTGSCFKEIPFGLLLYRHENGAEDAFTRAGIVFNAQGQPSFLNEIFIDSKVTTVRLF
jgi:hypothetical protein